MSTLTNQTMKRFSNGRVTFCVGNKVKVIEATDETLDSVYVGKVGEITGFITEPVVGNNEKDPLIEVRFEEEPDNFFWIEELEVL